MKSEVSHREDTSLPDLGVATTRTNSFLLEVITKNILLSNGSVGWLADLLGFPLASRSAFSQFSFEPAPDPGVKKQLWFNSSRNSHKLVVGPLAPQSTFQNSNNNNTNANEVSTHTNKQASISNYVQRLFREAFLGQEFLVRNEAVRPVSQLLVDVCRIMCCGNSSQPRTTSSTDSLTTKKSEDSVFGFHYILATA